MTYNNDNNDNVLFEDSSLANNGNNNNFYDIQYTLLYGKYNYQVLDDAEVYFGDDFEEIVADAGNNADLYAANQGSTELVNETYTEEAPLRFMGQDVLHHQPLSLD